MPYRGRYTPLPPQSFGSDHAGGSRRFRLRFRFGRAVHPLPTGAGTPLSRRSRQEATPWEAHNRFRVRVGRAVHPFRAGADPPLSRPSRSEATALQALRHGPFGSDRAGGSFRFRCSRAVHPCRTGAGAHHSHCGRSEATTREALRRSLSEPTERETLRRSRSEATAREAHPDSDSDSVGPSTFSLPRPVHPSPAAVDRKRLRGRLSAAVVRKRPRRRLTQIQIQIRLGRPPFPYRGWYIPLPPQAFGSDHAGGLGSVSYLGSVGPSNLSVPGLVHPSPGAVVRKGPHGRLMQMQIQIQIR